MSLTHSYFSGSMAGISGVAGVSAPSGCAISGASSPSFPATRLVSVRNSISARKFKSVSGSGSFSSRSSNATSRSIWSSSFTSCRLTRIWSAFSIRVWRRLGCLISSARSKSVSRSPNSLIRSAAVLMPIPGAPGTLSTLSPARACTSTTRLGPTPNFSSTPSTPIRLFFIGSSISTPPPTSCIRSLSDDRIVTRPPASSAWRARVAMMSSASNPSTSIQAMLKARVASRVSGNCGRRSSGAGGRLAL